MKWREARTRRSLRPLVPKVFVMLSLLLLLLLLWLLVLVLVLVLLLLLHAALRGSPARHRHPDRATESRRTAARTRHLIVDSLYGRTVGELSGGGLFAALRRARR